MKIRTLYLSNFISTSETIFQPFQIKRKSVQLDCCIVFFHCAKAAVKKSKVAYIRSFKIKQHFLFRMIFYKGINKAMRCPNRSAIRMITYQNIISPVVGKDENAGSYQVIFCRQDAITACLLPII